MDKPQTCLQKRKPALPDHASSSQKEVAEEAARLAFQTKAGMCKKTKG